jgi:hypothetical protein
MTIRRARGAEPLPSERANEILAELLTAEGDADSLPALLCETCERALPGTGVGLTLITSRGPTGPVTATNGVTADMEELQFSLGEGPSVDASRQGRPVLEPDLLRIGTLRWPGYGRAAIDAGVAAVFAFPLQIGSIRLGALALYRDVAGPLGQGELGEALVFADAATGLLLHMQDQMPRGGAVHPHLAAASYNRREVHQATGMIAIQAAVGLPEALLLLRAHAFTDGRSLVEVARDVVGRVLRFGPEEDHRQ